MNPDVLNDFIQRDEDLRPYIDYLEALAKPSVDIKFVPGSAHNHESRFGGIPLVPATFSWPSHDRGEYKFLGQINFSDIHDGPEELPQCGLLSLFYAYDENGEIFWGDDGYVLGYYWPILEDLELYVTPDIVQAAQKVSLSVGKEIPRNGYLADDWPFDTHEFCDLFEVEVEGVTEDYLLGYPSFCSLAYDPTPEGDWISLITLASHSSLDWCWHDGDKLMVFIEKSRLENKDFSHLKVDAG